MYETIINGLKGLNELLTAGIAITAFSLLIYALTFNLRDRVTRSFALVLICVVIVSSCDALAGNLSDPSAIGTWLRLEWIGIIFFPPAYVHFSDALLETTGRRSRGRRRRLVWVTYGISFIFLLTLATPWLVGPLVQNIGPLPHLRRAWLAWVFALFYLTVVAWSGVNFWRAYQRTVTTTSRRRMRYLLIGGLAPVLGTYPFLLFGSGLAINHALLFWFLATLSNLLVAVLLVLMAYAVAFFGVEWPDRVVKRRLFKWLMRGPVTVSIVLTLTTVVQRWVGVKDFPDAVAIPIVMVISFLLLEHLITLAAPFWERWLFHGGDPQKLQLLQALEERMLTTGDLRDFLESILAALCDRLQVSNAFMVVLGPERPEMLIMIGSHNPFEREGAREDLLAVASKNGGAGVIRVENSPFLAWKNSWLIPLHEEEDDPRLSGYIGVEHNENTALDEEQMGAILILANRAMLALRDIHLQQHVFASVEALAPQVEIIQRLRAAARYDGTNVLTGPELPLDESSMSKWVKDALSHYWGGPKLSQSPLMRLQIVQRALQEHDGNPTNALRSILQDAIERVRPEGERRFTGEWILYNILDLKFLEGRRVREIAMKLAMSEADLYRKQRVAIEAVAKAITVMEQEARKEVKEPTRI